MAVITSATGMDASGHSVAVTSARTSLRHDQAGYRQRFQHLGNGRLGNSSGGRDAGEVCTPGKLASRTSTTTA